MCPKIDLWRYMFAIVYTYLQQGFYFDTEVLMTICLNYHVTLKASYVSCFDSNSHVEGNVLTDYVHHAMSATGPHISQTFTPNHLL